VPPLGSRVPAYLTKHGVRRVVVGHKPAGPCPLVVAVAADGTPGVVGGGSGGASLEALPATRGGAGAATARTFQHGCEDAARPECTVCGTPRALPPAAVASHSSAAASAAATVGGSGRPASASGEAAMELLSADTSFSDSASPDGRGLACFDICLDFGPGEAKSKGGALGTYWDGPGGSVATVVGTLPSGERIRGTTTFDTTFIAASGDKVVACGCGSGGDGRSLGSGTDRGTGIAGTGSGSGEGDDGRGLMGRASGSGWWVVGRREVTAAAAVALATNTPVVAAAAGSTAAAGTAAAAATFLLSRTTGRSVELSWTSAESLRAELAADPS